MADSNIPITITVGPSPSRKEKLKELAARLNTTGVLLQMIINDDATEPGERIILNKNLAKIYDAAKAIGYIADRDKFSKPNNSKE